ncbi:MAG: hypothetical protein QG655_2945 [Actinomycetota bacterium]|nr:hypothetical protein [Actinomycetota bacterium]
MVTKSVPVGAAVLVLGMSLVGPQSGVATADDGSDGTAAVSSDSAGEAALAGRPTGEARRGPSVRNSPRVPRQSPESGEVRRPHARAAAAEVRIPGAAASAQPPANRRLAPEAAVASAAAIQVPPRTAVTALNSRYSRNQLSDNTIQESIPSTEAGAVVIALSNSGGQNVPPALMRQAPALQQLNTAAVRFFDAVSGLLSGLPGGPVTDLLAGALLLVRRGLFDQAPTVTSSHQLTSALQTEGTVIADDPEGDPVAIELQAAPEFGVLTLAADGRYIYTPGTEFAGADSFTVRATDTNGGFNILDPGRDPATLHTVQITGPAPSTMLTVNLRAAFLKDVTGTETGQPGAGTLNGSYVYLYQPQPADGAPNWTKLVDNGQITSAVNAPDTEHPDYWVNVALNAQGQLVNGGAIYLIVQSENPEPCQQGQQTNCHTDLTTVAGWQEAFVQQKVRDYNYGYTAFEYALLSQAGDQGDITYIPGFGPHVAVKVCATPSSCDTRGLALNATDFIAGLLKAGVSPEAVFTYPSAPQSSTPYSPLDGKPSIVISPSNGTFGANYYPETNWNDYLTKTIDALPPGAMTFSGTTAGARDAAGIWHNGQYYSYSVQAVKDGTGSSYYLFSPNANSQTQGYMLIGQTDVGKNLYAPGQGSALAALYESVTVSDGVITALGTPYDIPGRTPPGTTAPAPGQFNVSANNQWGNALTQYFTGFTAGNWGTVAEQANLLNQGAPDSANLAGPVDLNTNLNWDPAYAFDRNRVPGTAPAYQHNDQYSFYFYENANTYASAFSDNLAQKLNPGPQISLAAGPGVNQNVTQIDLYVFGADEAVGPDGDGFYKKPVSTNFLAQPTGGDYVIPTAPNSALTLQIQGFNVGSKVVDDATVKLGIYQGLDVDKRAQFDYVTLPTQGGAYQYFTVSGGPGSWTAGTAGANPLGFIQINGLPMPTTVAKDDVYWYQLVIADEAGGNQRVFNIYATAGGSTPGELTPFNPGAGVGSANDPAAAIDNNAGVNVFTTYNAGTFLNSQITVNLQPDASLPAALLTNGWDPNTVNKPQGPQAPGVNPIVSALAAPVVGHVSDGTFTAVSGQYGTGVAMTQGYPPIVNQSATAAAGTPVYFDNPLPTAHVTGSNSVAFGWTGTNSYAGEPDSNGVSYAPTMPVFQTAAPFTMTQAGQVGQYTNKILPGNTARVTVKQGTTVVGTVEGVADLDGQWQTDAISLAPGTYTATMTELTPAGNPVVDYLGRPKPDSVAVTLILAP